MTPEDRRLHALDRRRSRTRPGTAHDALETALFEIKRVIVGQEAMLERVLVALLAGGHVLLEGVPGLAKTLTVKTVADVLGGSFKRLQFTPDLVPGGPRRHAHLPAGHAAASTPSSARSSATSCSPTRSTARPPRCSRALLEVMQERQVTIGHETHRVPAPFLVLATQNPIESEGTYPLPEAQVDRFMFKLVVDYPTHRDEVAVVERSLEGGGRAREVLSPEQLATHQRAAGTVYVDRRVMEYAVALTTATREPGEENWVEFGASPRGSINLIHAGRALALLRGRDYMLPVDVRDLARDVLRHRIVLTYEALAAGVDADRVLDDVLERVPMPRIELAQERPSGTIAERDASRPRSCSACWRWCPLAAAAYVLVAAARAQVRGPLHERRPAGRGRRALVDAPRPGRARAARARGAAGRARAPAAHGRRRAP